MKRRKFMGLLAALPFVGGYLVKATAKAPAQVNKVLASALMQERLHETTVELVLVQEGDKVMTELWADFEMDGYKDEIIWYSPESVRPGELVPRHVWTKKLSEWCNQKRKGRVIIARLPATPEALRITFSPTRDDLAAYPLLSL